MKQLFVILLLTALIAGCSKNDNPVNSNGTSLLYSKDGIFDSIYVYTGSNGQKIGSLADITINSNKQYIVSYNIKQTSDLTYFTIWKIISPAENFYYKGHHQVYSDYTFICDTITSSIDCTHLNYSLDISGNGKFLIIKDLKIYSK